MSESELREMLNRTSPPTPQNSVLVIQPAALDIINLHADILLLGATVHNGTVAAIGGLELFQVAGVNQFITEARTSSAASIPVSCMGNLTRPLLIPQGWTCRLRDYAFVGIHVNVFTYIYQEI